MNHTYEKKRRSGSGFGCFRKVFFKKVPSGFPFLSLIDSPVFQKIYTLKKQEQWEIIKRCERMDCHEKTILKVMHAEVWDALTNVLKSMRI